MNSIIIDLSIYNKWKRSTLDRLTSRHRMIYERLIWSHLQSIRSQVEAAIATNQRRIDIHDPHLEGKLEQVFIEHQHDTVKVGVSDGIREVTPEKEMGTWTKYPWVIPVENTFTNLAEIKQRNKIYSDIWKKIFTKNKKQTEKAAQAGKRSYLDNIQEVFKKFADDYYGTEKWNKEPKSIANDFLRDVFDKSKVEAERILRTETTRYFNDARDDYFKEHTDVDFVQLIAVTDGRTSQICESRDLYVIPIGKSGQRAYKPPFHWNCRTIQSPLMSFIKRQKEQIKKNLGSEFGVCMVDGEKFKGARSAPNVPLPKSWH